MRSALSCSSLDAKNCRRESRAAFDQSVQRSSNSWCPVLVANSGSARSIASNVSLKKSADVGPCASNVPSETAIAPTAATRVPGRVAARACPLALPVDHLREPPC